MARVGERNYPGEFIEVAPRFGPDYVADHWVKQAAVCIDPTQIVGKHIRVFAFDARIEADGSTSHALRHLSAVPMRLVLQADSHYHFAGIDNFDDRSIGIWLDVIKGQPQPSWSELLGFTDITFYNEL